MPFQSLHLCPTYMERTHFWCSSFQESVNRILWTCISLEERHTPRGCSYWQWAKENQFLPFLSTLGLSVDPFLSKCFINGGALYAECPASSWIWWSMHSHTQMGGGMMICLIVCLPLHSKGVAHPSKSCLDPLEGRFPSFFLTNVLLPSCVCVKAILCHTDVKVN